MYNTFPQERLLAWRMAAAGRIVALEGTHDPQRDGSPEAESRTQPEGCTDGA
jgi:hypothetical protein